MWAWLPDVVVELLAELAPPAALPTLALLERRCRPPTSARLAILARLRAPPFSVGGGVILGREGGRLFLPGRGIGDAGLTTFASALGCGALPRLEVRSTACSHTVHSPFTPPSRATGALPRQQRDRRPGLGRVLRRDPQGGVAKLDASLSVHEPDRRRGHDGPLLGPRQRGAAKLDSPLRSGSAIT